MIEFYYYPTPNCKKVAIFLEESGLDYKVTPVAITKGEQFEPSFLRLFPNNRIPGIVDHAPADGGEPLRVFESGAILFYLAEKSGKFLPADIRGRAEVHSWLMWQMAGLGPICGQSHHFHGYAPPGQDYATTRFFNEAGRLYAVLDRLLAERDYIAGDYSIADMACYPWVAEHGQQRQSLDDFPHVQRWFATISQRPAIDRMRTLADAIDSNVKVTDESRKFLFGQTAQQVRQRG
ncbi:glutathione S-transferase [Sphingomonas sp. Root710]|uniref:glutathione S-transferase N-terminal domain-containing protein n=1 Tax=Sphingomonas sp. Root710 TaxID=1736594 RepID=UPI0006FD4AFA|nr:glutathione binding-like protein [Sphingomonas sp. Root710]KRB86593.1 glutathione S-transferase [Sphingomonas sp. Root710]